METVLRGITLFAVLCTLLVLAGVWLVAVLVKRKKAFLGRAIIVFILLLGAVIYLQPKAERKMNLVDLKAWIFPEEIPQYNYHVEQRGQGPQKIIEYIFSAPYPSLTLSMEKDGKYFHIRDVMPVNRVLKQLDLPTVKEGVPELASITGSQLDVNQYLWEDYPGGALLLERSMCQQGESLVRYHCIIYIQIRGRF